MKKSPRNFRRSKAKPDRASARPHQVSSQDDQRRPHFSLKVPVLYEDEAIVVVDKPAGLLSVPIKGSDTPSAKSLLVAELKLKGQRPFVVHRIDRFVSGILLFAKTRVDREELVRQFLDHTPVRQYLAVVRGRVAPEAGTLVHYFQRGGMFQQLRSSRDPEATRAELRYTVEDRFADTSVVRVELVTGLQNQIRAQFSAMGHPVIGDRKYHPEESSEQLIARVALHAAHLEFVHPRSGETISIDCKPPADFRYLLQRLSHSGRTRR